VAKVLDEAEPLVAYARAAWRRGRPDEARGAIAACCVYAGLFGPPQYVRYDPAAFIKARGPRLADDAHTLHVEPVTECVGDPDRVFDCLRQLVCGVVLEADSVLAVEVFEQAGEPCIALAFDGPGRFPSEVAVDGFLPLSLEELGRRWTLATRGGRIDDAPNGLLLRLTGQRMPPEPVADLEPLLEALGQAADHAASDDARTRETLEGCLALVEGEGSPPETVGVKAVVGEVIDAASSILTERCINAETLLDPNAPPLLLRRDRVRAFFATVVRYATAILPNAGSLTLMTDYQAGERVLGVVVAIEGPRSVTEETFHLAGLRRAVVEVHDGTLEWAPDSDGVTITATFPDRVGRALDEWIPGFDAFAERSRQMLRLLKSGGPAPPEDFLLDGVLEAELERWLLPCYAGAAAVNLAHDLSEKTAGLPGSSPARLKKALTQIKRGKPRKEIAAPPYAAEVLWAFRRDDRHRKAVGAEALDEDALERLCRALLETPPDYAKGLRLVARAIADRP